MKYVEVGGTRMSAVGLGTWQFGSTEWGYGSEYARREAVKIVHRALDLGVSLIDTAEIYGLGRSEKIVGEAIKGRRDQVFLASGRRFHVQAVAAGAFATTGQEQRGRKCDQAKRERDPPGLGRS